MNKCFFSFILGMFIISFSFGQDYSFTIVDNSDFENNVKYGVKTCHLYNFPDLENAPNDSILVNSYYYNELGLVTLEIDYVEPEDSTQKWILTAQYDGSTIISEQWKWENNDTDSTTYYYDDQGMLNKACVKYYFEGEFDELECEEYAYKNGEVINLSYPRLIDSVIVKNDTSFHYYGTGQLWFTEFNGRKIAAYSYNEDNTLIAKYDFVYDAKGVIIKTIKKDPNDIITGEFHHSYNGTLITQRIEYNKTTGLMSKESFIYTYFE